MNTIAEKKVLADSYNHRTIEFIPNAGQFDLRILYMARVKGYQVFFLTDRIIFDFISVDNKNDDCPAVAVALVFDGSNPEVKLLDLLPKEGVFNFYIGKDPSEWHENIHSFSELVYSDLWPNIDLKLHGNGGELKFDWIIKPTGDPRIISMHYEGADSLSPDDKGNLMISYVLGDIKDLRPFAVQEIEGKIIPVDCSFEVHDMTVGFSIGVYDPAHILLIDPAVTYTTYLGGSGADAINAVAVDDDGNAYFTGKTASYNFPVTIGAYKPIRTGLTNAFITKMAPDGASLVYSTYLGGAASDEGLAIAIDPSGAAYVTGFTTSTNFPTVNPCQMNLAGSQDAFVSKLSINGGSLVYSTYLGGASGSTAGRGISVNIFGQTFIAGQTSSASFPTTTGAFSTTYNGGPNDGFISLLSSNGNALLASTYLGGSGNDIINGLALDPSDFIYITGSTNSSNFPVTSRAYQTSYAGSTDAFITKLEGDLSASVYSTYIGGSNMDIAYSISLDSAYKACIAGTTSSANFPVTAGAYQMTLAGTANAFITKISSDGGSLIFSTYLGGNASDTAYAIALDTSGHAWVAGSTTSANFPTTPAVIPSSATGSINWFISMLSSGGSTLLASYLLGGSSTQIAYGIVINPQGAAVIAGSTSSSNFPVTAGAYQTVYGGGSFDGAATKVNIATFSKASLTITELLG